MEKKEFLEQIAEELHQVVIATLDDVKKPATNLVALVTYENTIGFVVERKSELYKQVLEQGYVSLLGYNENRVVQMNGNVLLDEYDKNVFYVVEGEG